LRMTFMTIGIAVYNDYSGAFMTMNALRHYHYMEDVELLVVNNAPENRQSFELKAMCSMMDDVPCRYVDYRDATGAANAKNAVVENALGDYVLVLDSHVLLVKDAVRKLKEFYRMVPDTQNLYQGPLITHATGPRTLATHLHPKWGSGMLGQWSTAWRRLDGKMVQTYHEAGKLMVTDLLTNQPVDTGNFDWSNHEEKLEALGYRLAVESDEPFEIPAQGMGLFSCKRSEWLGFNPDFREFGGEEFYLNDKYKHHGRATYCLPFLRWHHRFFRDVQPNYPNRLESKLRNFIIGHRELGQDIHPVVTHFLELGMNPKLVEQITANPDSVVMIDDAGSEPKALAGDNGSRVELIQRKLPGDAGDALKRLSQGRNRVTEFSSDPDTPIFLLAGNPKTLTSYVTKLTPEMTAQQAMLPTETHHATPITWHLHVNDALRSVESIEKTDMLLIRVGDAILAEELLAKHAGSVGSVIVVDTTAAGPFVELNDNWVVSETAGTSTVLIKRRPDRSEVYGAGTELSRFLGWMGFEYKPTCSCKDKSRLMDVKGIKWCEENTEAIVKWLKDAHDKEKPKMPWVGFAVGWLVRFSIFVAKMRGAK
jgi:glycosyltransferase involved in cell wall biosynthesis